jgi:hypothetical protein
MSDQERRLNEILDLLGLPRNMPYRDYTRELVERCVSLEKIYGAMQLRTIRKGDVLRTRIARAPACRGVVQPANKSATSPINAHTLAPYISASRQT